MSLSTRIANETRHERAVRFFYDNAGWSYRPEEETKEHGHRRSAEALAKAEEWAFENDMAYEWGDDECIGGDCGEIATCDHACCQGDDHEVLYCVMFDSAHKNVASLGSICGATQEYRRVVEAELALEAMNEREK